MKFTHWFIEKLTNMLPRLQLLGCLAILAVTIAGVTFYVFRVYTAYLNSDAATANILAGEMLRSGSLFPEDWWYVNNDIWILFKQLPIALYAMVGANGFYAHAFGVFVGTLLLIISSFTLLRHAGASLAAAALGTALLCIGMSDAYLEMVFGEGAYAWTTAFILGCLCCIIRLRESTGRSLVAWLGLAILTLFLVMSNPARFIAYFFIPIILSIAIVLAAPTTKDINHTATGLRSYVWGSLGILLSLGLGIVAHYLLRAELSNLQGASNSHLVPLDQIPARLGLTAYAVLYTLGIDWTPGTSIASTAGLMMLAKLCLLPALLALPIESFLGKDTGKYAFHRRLIAGVAVTGMLAMVLLTAASTLQGKSSIEAVYTTRYLLPYLQILLLCNVLYWFRMDIIRRTLLVGAVALSLLYSPNHLSPSGLRQQETQEMASNSGFSFRLGWRSEAEKRRQVVEKLAAAGLKFGYAPYWHSHTYTVISNGNVEIRPIHLENGELRPWLHLSSSRWYKSGYADGEVFLLVPASMSEQILAGLDRGCAPKYSRTIRIEEYLVLIYSSNPLLSSMESNLNASGKVCLKSAGLTQNGIYDAASDTLVAARGVKPGFVRFGPYTALGRGDYVVRFRVHTNGSDANLGYVDVTTNHGKRVVRTAPLQLGEQLIEIPLAVKSNVENGIEFRVFSTGKATISVQEIELFKTGRNN